MTPLFAKLNWKGQSPVWLLDAPASFDAERAGMGDLAWVTDASRRGDADPMPFVLAFVTTRQRVIELAPLVDRHTLGDGIVWMAYPKRTSKRLTSDLDRDNGWEPLRAVGFDTVRQVAIDEDWSALRFRRERFIARR